MSVVISSLAH